MKIKKIKLKKRHKEICADLLIYVVFFILGLSYYLNLESTKDSEIFIYHNTVDQKPIISEKADNKVETPDKNYLFVASSRGKYFYPINCPRAATLSEKNKVFFTNLEEAKKSKFEEYKC